MNKIDKLAKAITESSDDKAKTSAYDTTAEVVDVENGLAWVSIPGGVAKTPATMVVNAKVGDSVRVRVTGGKAYVTGNATAPPTDDTTALRAEDQAIRATQAADTAAAQADLAHRSADSAQRDATTAQKSANRAQKSANGKNTIYYGSTEPTEGVKGDTWFNSAEDNAIYIFNGSTWVKEELGENAIAELSIKTAHIQDGAITNAKIGNLDAGKITSGTIDTNRLDVSGIISVGDIATDAEVLAVHNEATDARKYADNYLTVISQTTGISVHDVNDTSNYVNITSNAVNVVTGGTNVAQFGSTVRVGASSGKNVSITSSDFGFLDNGVSLASFSPTMLRLGQSGGTRAQLENDSSYHGLEVFNESNVSVAWIGTSARIGSASDYNVYITSSAVNFRSGSTVTGYITGTNARLGALTVNGHITIDSTEGLRIWASNETYSHAQLKEGFFRIGAVLDGQSRTVIQPSGIDFLRRDGTTDVNLAHIGYASGTAPSGTAVAPYYTFGTRASGTIGNYSTSIGYNNTASGYVSTAIGHSNTASRSDTIAGGAGCTANGDFSVAIGYEATTSGSASCALNTGTIANGDSQTVIGQFNVADTTSAFIIGNGASSGSLSARSNALTVDWSGNVNIPSGAKYKINGTALSASDVGAVSKSGDTMTGSLVLSNATYLYSKNPSGTNRILTGINANNEWFFGYGSRAYSEGSVYFDGNVVNIRSNGAVNITAPSGVTNSGTYTALYKITTETATLSSGIPANSYASALSITMTAQSGYNAVGIVGWSSSNWRIRPTTNYVASNTSLYAGFANDTATAVTSSVDVVFRVLWLKATAG